MSEYRDKLLSISVGRERKAIAPKVTTDVHDRHTVDVTEHWSERVDVTVKPETLRYSMKKES